MLILYCSTSANPYSHQVVRAASGGARTHNMTFTKTFFVLFSWESIRCIDTTKRIRLRTNSTRNEPITNHTTLVLGKKNCLANLTRDLPLMKNVWSWSLHDPNPTPSPCDCSRSIIYYIIYQWFRLENIILGFFRIFFTSNSSTGGVNLMPDRNGMV